MNTDHRSLIGEGIDTAEAFERSPLRAGFVTGLKAALMGAPLGAGIQLLRGASPVGGAVVGGGLAALIAGLAGASSQKLQNLDTEAALRYHASRIKEREPLFFMPPKHEMGKYFSRRFENRHAD